MAHNKGKPAFARSASFGQHGGVISHAQTGMSLHQYFFGQALNGLLAAGSGYSRMEGWEAKVVHNALTLADIAMSKYNEGEG